MHRGGDSGARDERREGVQEERFRIFDCKKGSNREEKEEEGMKGANDERKES